jgi:hypothetical protein
VKGESVYKGLMTLIPLKWKRTVLYCNLGFVKHVFPRKQCFLKILIYITDYIHLKKKKKGFQNGLEKSIFSILTNQDTQPRSQVKVHNNNKHFRVVCENIKSFSTYCFWVKGFPFSLSLKHTDSLLNHTIQEQYE